jgi:hypothetical protein
MKRLTKSAIACLIALHEPERWMEKRHGVYVVVSDPQGEIFAAFHPRTVRQLEWDKLILNWGFRGRWALTQAGKIAADTGHRPSVFVKDGAE